MRMRQAGRVGFVFVAMMSAGAVAAQNRPAITGIAFVRMYSADRTASDAFYGKTLGFQAITGADGIERYGVNPSQWLEVESLPANPPEKRIPLVAFTTRDAKRLEKYLKQHDVAVAGRLEGSGFTVRDPEGNLIGFMQRGAMRDKLLMSPRAAARRIIHTGFLVHDRAAEDAFYRDVLGFQLSWQGGRTDSVVSYVDMQVPEGTDWLEYMLSTSPHPDARDLGVINHFSLGTATMGDVVAALKSNGCSGPACSNSHTGRDGKVQLTQFDPDLTRVEFMEFKPTGTTCCSPMLGRVPREDEDQ